MIDQFPDDIILYIIKHLENNHIEGVAIFFEMDFQQILILKKINRYLNQIISQLQNSWLLIPNKYLSNNVNINDSHNLLKNTSHLINIKKERSEKLDSLCKKKTSLSTFTWLMDNNIFFSLSNIKTLIMNGRIDVIKKGFYYKEFLDLIFNRFYIDPTKSNEIFSITENINPIVVAIEYNQLNIVKLLLESSSHGNPFLNMIPSLLDLSIKYINKTILSYLIIYYPNKLNNSLENRIINILYRFPNSEDIIFHLLQNKLIHITDKIMYGAITKNYYDLFIYCYNNHNTIHNRDLIIKSIEAGSNKILDHLLDIKSNISPSMFSSTLFKNKKNNKIFIQNIIQKYLHLVPKENPLIRLAIENEIENDSIIFLINNGYSYDKEDIINALNNKNIELTKCLVNNLS